MIKMNSLNIMTSILLIMSMIISGCQSSDSLNEHQVHNISSDTKAYGVFIGEDDLDKISSCAEKYDIIVIEGQQFDNEDIKILKTKCQKVYTYLNVGSIEKYRDYYDIFKPCIIGEYENWSDEYWLDVTSETWQEFIADKIASELKEKGFDGFFVDNCDVYYIRNAPEIYNGLVNIIEKLRNLNSDIIINGGDLFVKRLIEDKKEYLIDGINQECVLTTIKDYDNDIFERQSEEEKEYFIEYLNTAKNTGLKVFILEYTSDKIFAEEIKKYCAKNNFTYYISNSIKLETSSENG